MGQAETDASEAPSSSEEGVGGGASQRQTLLQRAAAMRNNPTEPERRLWMALRDKRFNGYKFRRQAVIGGRIADVFCPAKGLVVEIDGEAHDRDNDLVRDRRLSDATGFVALRFTNDDVMRNPEGVLVALELALDGQRDRWPDAITTPPRPPPLKRRGS